MKRKSPIVPTALVLAGLGVGNMTAQPETVQLPTPEPIVLPAERIEVPVRFEELTHTVDRSVREKLKMDDDAKNSELVDNHLALAKGVKDLTAENAFLRKENERVVAMYNRLVTNKPPTLTEQYYNKQNSRGN